MRNVILTTSAALVLAVSANAEMVEKTTTTTTYSGTIAEASPATSTIILKDTPQTVKYIYNDKTVWQDPTGKTVRLETVRDQPVTILYEQQGDQMIVTKVITQKAAAPRLIEKVVTQQAAEPRVIEKKTTTTMTTETDD